MKVVFFSPHFPAYGAEFCDRLKQTGATVLGIGDAPYEGLSARLKSALSEYYRVGNMEDEDQILRAMGHFIHRWGRIDRFDSLNEHWIEMDAAIRTDFNIFGMKHDFVENLKHKSKMGAYFDEAGVATIQQHKYVDRSGAEAFIKRVGYPVVIKPDQGSGASMTLKVDNDANLAAFERSKPAGTSFVIQQYIDGIILTYDGLVNRDGEIVFAASHRFEQSIMEVVNTDSHLHYYCLPFIDPAIEEAGRNTIKAFGLREKFFHIEFFQTGAEQKIVALEINMRPPGAWMTDAINFSYDTDVYRLWADMVVRNKVDGPLSGRYYTGYASRKDHIRYRHDHVAILAAHGDSIVNYNRIEPVFSRAMGNCAYQFRSENFDDVRAIVRFIQDVEI